MARRMSPTQRHIQSRRSTPIRVAGILMIIVGVFGLIDSYLILASTVIFGWLILGVIGFATLTTGVGLYHGGRWAWHTGVNLNILNLFIGFIEVLGAFNYRFVIRGWVGLGQALGAATIVLSAVTLAILYRRRIRRYFES
jgi:hypothetical protein